MYQALGQKVWVIPQGYIPKESSGRKPEMESHETACILNTSNQDAHIEIFIYFSDKDPVGPYSLTVPPQRTKHVRFNDLDDPQPIPKAKDYSSVIKSDMPVVVQHTRLDSRQAENALLSTVAYPSAESQTSKMESSKKGSRKKKERKSWLGGIKEKFESRIDEERIDEAIGRYITVNVLSRQDEFIAKRGDLITHEIVEKASREGMLEKILSHTSKKPIK